MIAALGLVAWGTGVANANDLCNGNLDAIAISSAKIIYADRLDRRCQKSVSGPVFRRVFVGAMVQRSRTRRIRIVLQAVPRERGRRNLRVYFYQDNPATPGTKFTLSGYAAGEANYSGFFTTNNPPPKTLFFVEFLDAAGNGLVTNVLDLVAAGLPSDGPGSMAQFTTPQFTAPANTTTVRAGACDDQRLRHCWRAVVFCGRF